MEGLIKHFETKEASTTTIGIDLAKNVLQVHGVDERGHVVLRKQVRRDQLTSFMVSLSPCLMGMEASGNAHDWARKLQSFRHTVKLMSPQFVKQLLSVARQTLIMSDFRHRNSTKPERSTSHSATSQLEDTYYG